MEALQLLNENMVLDGELIVLDKNGISNFQLLQHYPEVPPSDELIYYLFDLLSYKGKNLCDNPLLERKELLRHILPKKGIIGYSARRRQKKTMG